MCARAAKKPHSRLTAGTWCVVQGMKYLHHSCIEYHGHLSSNNVLVDTWCVVQGMKYLHHSCIEYHGHLSSNNVLVDTRWTCKITDHGLRYVRSLIHTEYYYAIVPGEYLLYTSIFSPQRSLPQSHVHSKIQAIRCHVLRTCGHGFELPTIKYEFNKRNFIFCSLLTMCDFLLYYLSLCNVFL